MALDLEELVSLMVEAPSRVRVHEHRQDRGTLFRLRLAEEDLGKVIGRQGRTARALRTLLDARGEVEKRNYALEIREW